MHKLLIAILLFTITAQAQDNPKDIPTKLFTAMNEKNAEAIRALFIPGGQLVAIDGPRTGKGPSTTRLFTGDSFAKLISESRAAKLIERMVNPKVEVFGDMALVYGQYTFHVVDNPVIDVEDNKSVDKKAGTERFSHCGTNIFNLIRTSEGWKIANATSTLEFQCRK